MNQNDTRLARDVALGDLPDQQSDLFDLSYLMRALWRRKSIIFGIFVVCFAIGLVNILQLSPRYTASSKITLGAPQTQIVDMESVVQGVGQELQRIPA